MLMSVCMASADEKDFSNRAWVLRATSTYRNGLQRRVNKGQPFLSYTMLNQESSKLNSKVTNKSPQQGIALSYQLAVRRKKGGRLAGPDNNIGTSENPDKNLCPSWHAMTSGIPLAPGEMENENVFLAFSLRWTLALPGESIFSQQYGVHEPPPLWCCSAQFCSSFRSGFAC